jgi:pyrimidine deaminase RibD-like protein
MSAQRRSFLREANKVTGRNYRHVAVVFRGGSILAIGNNVSRHAEVAALSKLFPSERAGTTVLSMRIRKDGSFANGKPCANCMAYMIGEGVKKIEWSNSNGAIIKERLYGP